VVRAFAVLSVAPAKRSNSQLLLGEFELVDQEEKCSVLSACLLFGKHVCAAAFCPPRTASRLCSVLLSSVASEAHTRHTCVPRILTRRDAPHTQRHRRVGQQKKLLAVWQPRNLARTRRSWRTHQAGRRRHLWPSLWAARRQDGGSAGESYSSVVQGQLVYVAGVCCALRVSQNIQVLRLLLLCRECWRAIACASLSDAMHLASPARIVWN
jgi:hypothetical protein